MLVTSVDRVMNKYYEIGISLMFSSVDFDVPRQADDRMSPLTLKVRWYGRMLYSLCVIQRTDRWKEHYPLE